MEVMNDSISTHIFTIYLLLALVSFNLYRLFTQTDFFKIASVYKIITPFFHFINSVVVYTGMIVAAFTHDLSITVVFMIATAIFIMVSEIKRYKKMRIIKVADIKLQKEFILFARKIAFLQFGAIALTYIISKLF